MSAYPDFSRDDLTYGQIYGYACENITTQEEADKFLNELVVRCMKRWDMSREDALKCELGNIGYFSGYYGGDVQGRMARLFNAVHPIFGKAPFDVTPEEAFKKGFERGQQTE